MRRSSFVTSLATPAFLAVLFGLLASLPSADANGYWGESKVNEWKTRRAKRRQLKNDFQTSVRAVNQGHLSDDLQRRIDNALQDGTLRKKDVAGGVFLGEGLLGETRRAMDATGRALVGSRRGVAVRRQERLNALREFQEGLHDAVGKPDRTKNWRAAHRAGRAKIAGAVREMKRVKKLLRQEARRIRDLQTEAMLTGIYDSGQMDQLLHDMNRRVLAASNAFDDVVEDVRDDFTPVATRNLALLGTGRNPDIKRAAELKGAIETMGVKLAAKDAELNAEQADKVADQIDGLLASNAIDHSPATQGTPVIGRDGRINLEAALNEVSRLGLEGQQLERRAAMARAIGGDFTKPAAERRLSVSAESDVSAAQGAIADARQKYAAALAAGLGAAAQRAAGQLHEHEAGQVSLQTDQLAQIENLGQAAARAAMDLGPNGLGLDTTALARHAQDIDSTSTRITTGTAGPQGGTGTAGTGTARP